MKKFIDKLACNHITDQKFLRSLSRGKYTWYIPGGKREGEIEKLEFFPYCRKAESSLVDHLTFDGLLAKNLIV